MKVVVCIVLLFVLVTQISSAEFKYQIKEFPALIDHFSYVDNRTFQLRYLINDTYLSDENSPILFYTGNEGDIELFAANTGFMWKLAPSLNAILVFAEHRYYGKSMPFGADSYKSAAQLGYLTSEQALSDYADLLQFLNPNQKRPVITFGGSYGGMLSAWFRMKYPHLVAGAIASSAPILQFPGVVPCDIFNRILTSVYKTALKKPDCATNIQKLWPILQNYSSTDEGRKVLNQKFKFCVGLNKTEDIDQFFDYLQDVFGNLAMANYPYPANFLAPLPAYPVRQFCGELDGTFETQIDLIDAFESALQIYSNFTGSIKCLNTSSAYDSSLGSQGWDFQACTEMVMPMCANGTTDMFLPKKWDFKAFSDDCYKKYKVYPRENAAVTQYGGQKLETASNIVFSNGLLDPWSGGGVLRSYSDDIKVVIIPEGAHHIDLRGDDLVDPASVKETRKIHEKQIKKWIQDFY
ncbi:unnamed protein product [Diamesa hyperborea]